jgi:hypothetical protein
MFTEDECDAIDAHREATKYADDLPELPQCPHRGMERCEEDAGHRGRHTFACDDGSCCEPPAQLSATVDERRFGRTW